MESGRHGFLEGGPRLKPFHIGFEIGHLIGDATQPVRHVNGMAQHRIDGREVAENILTTFHGLIDGGEGAGEEPLRLATHGFVLALRREQQRVHDDGVHRRHYHAFAIVEPLQIFRVERVIHGGLEAPILVPLQDVFGNRAALEDGDIAVVQNWNAAKGMTRFVLI